MQRPPLWKPVLILAVIALFFVVMYPPQHRLKPGLDLAGGTVLVYEVDVPYGQDARDVIERTIEVLKRRVDPDGVRNLVWRRQQGNRFEVQMALPPRDTALKREAYQNALKALLDDNINVRRLDGAIHSDPQQRDTLLAALLNQHPAAATDIQNLIDAGHKLDTVKKPYDEQQELADKLSNELKNLPIEATTEDRDQMKENVRKALEELQTRTRAYLDAQSAVQKAEDALVRANINADALAAALDRPDKPEVKDDPSSSPRARAIQALKTQYPRRAAEIDAVAAAHEAYQKVKGTLDDPNDLIALMRGAGVLEFRIAAAPGTISGEADYRQQLRERGPNAGEDREYRWFVIDDISRFAEGDKALEAVKQDPEGYFAQSRNMVGQERDGQYYVLLANTPGNSMTQNDPGWQLTSAVRSMDQQMQPAVAFSLNPAGAALMGRLTGNHLHEPMAIVLDARVVSAPSINDRISGSGIITGGRGGFSANELRYLINTLGAGSLQARVSDQPIYIKTIGSQFGHDNLMAGLWASVWSLVIVAGFMLLYYFLPGFVADLALFGNMVVILGAMAMIDATFTLPGIAGIVLTIGMAVDANVLIFERIREEIERKADLRTAVRLGYEKALTTIVDSNLTTLITCIVLYYTATTEVKGFALTLMIGILATMFTALFCTRVVFDWYLYLFKPTKLPMLPMVSSVVRRILSPNVPWMTTARFFIPASLAVMVLSVVAVYFRGVDMLDIEFRSGTQVGFELREGQTMSLQDARDRLTKASRDLNFPELANARPVSIGKEIDGKYTGFSIAVLDEDSNKVSDAIKKTFGDALSTQSPIAFKGMGEEGSPTPPVAQAPVYVVRSGKLGDDIDRPTVGTDVSDFVGGVAIVLNDVQPAQTLDAIRTRLERGRMQPAYESLGFRPSTVVPLSATGVADDGKTPVYNSFAVVSRDNKTDYTQTPDTFEDASGLAQTEWGFVRDAMLRDTSLSSVAKFSSQVSGDMKRQALGAVFLSLLAVVAYIWLRFGSFRYGVAAIAALVHDVTIGVGLVAIEFYIPAESALGKALMLDAFRIDLALVAAILTLVGYSLNDTIVVFDRIRENRGKLARATPAIINDSINQTISRTVLTSGTTLLAIFVLYIVGGPGVHGFAFMMLVGVVVGTYSSIAIAAPLLLMGYKVGDEVKKVVGKPATA
ncbi:MAG: protein translocase subunit SecD [Phycisphaera sp.]|nr:protein translocase subunit SecD [Phycisphaera sp.]